MSYAIETYYDGYYFRSKTEARWAVFLNQLNVEYQYEPDCFEWDTLNDGMVRYLPDFYLPKSNQYLEVKGTYPGQRSLMKVELLCEHEEKDCIIAVGIPQVNEDDTGTIEYFKWEKATAQLPAGSWHYTDDVYLFYVKADNKLLAKYDPCGIVDSDDTIEMRKAAAVAKAWRFDDKGELTDEQIDEIRNKVHYEYCQANYASSYASITAFAERCRRMAKRQQFENQGDLFGRPKLP